MVVDSVVDIGIQQANGQPLLYEGGCQTGGDRRLADAAFPEATATTW